MCVLHNDIELSKKKKRFIKTLIIKILQIFYFIEKLKMKHFIYLTIIR
ncbi:hypothetical protein BFGS084_01282 [Bacteroides fragilis]|nr:hypothetical protein HMPREF1205_02166 [Bacteroides fragilis HMW 616]EKA89175.1 hypothetical protein HMPREF1203_03304 [Bacteroides fragilis HMW 610]WMI93872.1 hypothetical protein BFGS084_01282 [Bacteroides fragilis]